jgi:RNA polymerase sigma-70 factor (ECF subfamily)
VKNHSDAEDILHDVCVIAIDSFGQLEKKGSFFPWVREIAFQQVVARSRKMKRESPVNPHVVAALADAVGRVEEQKPQADMKDAMLRCLDKLPVHSQVLIMMRYADTEGGVSEIALSFGKSMHSVYSRLKRVKALLRDCVAKQLASEVSS